MKIIMIGMDGVVIDKSYKTTKDISKTVQSIQGIQAKESCLILPNSDTPIPRLSKFFYRFLGITPKVSIGELGAVVDFLGKLYLHVIVRDWRYIGID